jgi:hypothetical protein
MSMIADDVRETADKDLNLVLADVHLAPEPEETVQARFNCREGCHGCREGCHGCREGCVGCREGCVGCRWGCRGCRWGCRI